MASYKWNDKEYPQVPYDDWTAGELSNAEHAFGKALDGSSTGDIAAAMFFVAVKRLEPEMNEVMLADAARSLPMSELVFADDEGEAPLETPFGPAVPLTSGLQPLEASE